MVWWDVEGIGAQLRCGSFSTPGVWCRSEFGRRGDERACPGKVWDPYPLPVRLVVVEPPDPHVDEVVWGALPGGEECLELPHADVGSSMWEEGHSKVPVGVDALELPLESA